MRIYGGGDEDEDWCSGCRAADLSGPCATFSAHDDQRERGTVERGSADQLKPYSAGGLIAMPPGMEHFVQTTQETVVQISTRGPWALKYVNPEDKAAITQ
jgi:hypothetical protein